MNLWQARKEVQLCPKCGIVNPELGYVVCKECTRKSDLSTKKSILYYRQIGICPKCKKAKLENRKNFCEECAKKMSEANRKKHPKKINPIKPRKERVLPTRAERKELGLCYYCGIEKADEGYKTCTSCREKLGKQKKESREYFRSIRVCPICRKEKLFGDEKHCPECVAKIYTRQRERRTENPEYFIEFDKKSPERHRNLRKKREDEGLCISCGKRPPKQNRKSCAICLGKRSRYNVEFKKRHNLFSEISRQERVDNHLCYVCGNPIDTDKKLCSSCCKRMGRNFDGHRKPNPYWQKLTQADFERMSEKHGKE